jgi:hypothetical protein
MLVVICFFPSWIGQKSALAKRFRERPSASFAAAIAVALHRALMLDQPRSVIERRTASRIVTEPEAPECAFAMRGAVNADCNHFTPNPAHSGRKKRRAWRRSVTEPER